MKRDVIAIGFEALLALTADRLERLVVYLTSRDRRHKVVEQTDQAPRDASLRLTALAEQHNILSREDGALDLRNNRFVISNDAWKQRLALAKLIDQILAQLGLDRQRLIAGFAQFPDG